MVPIPRRTPGPPGPGVGTKRHYCPLRSWIPSFFQIKRSSIRKGMVMVSPRLNPQASWEFEAEILVLHHPTTISPRYQAMGRCWQPRRHPPPPTLTALPKCSSYPNPDVSLAARSQVSVLFSDAIPPFHP